MSQTKRFILCVVILITTSPSFGDVTNVKSVTGSGSSSHNVADSNVFGKQGLNHRLKRMSTPVEAEQEEDVYPPARLSESFGESLTDNAYSKTDSEYGNMDKKASSFVRIGRMLPMNRFIRIGRLPGSELSSNDPTYTEGSENEQTASQFDRIGRSPSSFVRIGRLDRDENEDGFDKRASAFVRIGKSRNAYSGQTDNFLENIKRASQFVRVGRGPFGFVRIGKSPSSFVRIGKSPSSFVRIGRSPSSFVRIGKSNFNNYDKRGSSFVRIGKSPVFDLAEVPENSDKRVSGFVRIGKSDDSDRDLLKRASSFVRIGKSGEEDKRASSFVRIGKSDQSEEDDKDKRVSSFVRIGKSGLSKDMAAELNKRVSSFVRIGKSPLSDNALTMQSSSIEPSLAPFESLPDGNMLDDEEPIHVANRGSAFVRIGKIPSSAFVRIGKNKDLIKDPAEYSRGFRDNQSSFVRIGK